LLKISEKTIEKISNDIVDLIESSQGTYQKQNPEAGGQVGNQEEFWHNYIKRVDPHEKKYIEIIFKSLNRQANEVFDKIEKYPNDTDKWKFDKKKWIGEFADIEATFLVKLYKQEGQKAIDEALKLARKKKSIKAEIPISIAFDLFNPLVKAELLRQTTRFPAGLIDTTEEIIRNNIATGLELGESIDKIADRIMEKLGNEANKNRAEKISRSETIYGSNAGAELGYIQSGVVEGKQWLTAIDERTCDFCLDMNDKTELLGSSFDISDIDLNFDYSDGQMPYPPLHSNCYSEDTEIYTNKGWKYFKDLKKSEKILSLNPENYNLEWLSFISYIKYNYIGNMVSFTSNSFDLLVTPDHPIVLQKDWDRKVNRNKLSTRLARELITSNKGRFYRSSKWIGIDKDIIDIDGLKINTNVFCKFMGIYLAEGSTIIRKKESGSTYYQISIAQNHERINEIYNNIKDIPIKLMVGKDHITSYDKTMGKYLIQFGKSFEKYVPQIIKDLSSKYIKLFLDMYCFGDGTVKKGKYWKGGQFRNGRTFCTSSKRLADDTGELILKIGHHPSYRFDKTKGKEVKFRNGIFKLNTDMYRINDCYSPYASHYKINEIPYNGKVYDIELPKNHIFYVKRNGKCVWGSNCRCTIIPIVKKI